MRVSLTTVFVFAIAMQAAAQNIPASPVFDTQTAIASPSQGVTSFMPVRTTLAAPVKPTKPRVFDRKFLVLAGIATAATVLDVATTTHCMSTYANCQEGNPLLGSHPSQAKLYGVSFSMLGGQLLASAWMRRKTPNGKLWMVPQIVATAGHGLAAALSEPCINSAVSRTLRGLEAGTRGSCELSIVRTCSGPTPAQFER